MKGSVLLLCLAIVSKATSYEHLYYYGDDRDYEGAQPSNNDGDYSVYYEDEYGDLGPGGKGPEGPIPPPKRPTGKPTSKPAEQPEGNKPATLVEFPSECGINRYNNTRRSLDRRDLASLLRGTRSIGDLELFKRIMGGKEAKRGAYPWIAFFLIEHADGSMALCGGSLIHPEWIVSAGHCFFGTAAEGYPPMAKKLNKINVVLGEHDNAETVREESEQVITPAKIIVHPDYNPHSTSEKDDIALVKLSKPATLNEYVRVICLPDRPIPPGTTCYAAGWGSNRQGTTPNKLHDVKLIAISLEKCRPHHPDHNFVDAMMCAMHPPGVELGDACEGDSGGPLSCLVGDQFVLAGAVSFGVDCKRGDKAPGVYANVHHFKDWIVNVMSAN